MLRAGDGNMSVTGMFRHGVSGLAATRRKYSRCYANFHASATGWVLHKQTSVDRDATRNWGEAPKNRPLAAGNVLSRLAHYHAIDKPRTYLDVLAFCKPSPPDFMRVISGTGRGALALFFPSHESSFKVPSDC
jgi:hypothetical protein